MTLKNLTLKQLEGVTSAKMVAYEPQGADSHTEDPAKKNCKNHLYQSSRRQSKGFQQRNTCLVMVQRPRLQVPSAEGPGHL